MEPRWAFRRWWIRTLVGDYAGNAGQKDSGNGQIAFSAGERNGWLRIAKVECQARRIPQARLISRAQLISRAPLTVASGALSAWPREPCRASTWGPQMLCRCDGSC